MTEKRVPYEAGAIPTTLGEVLRAICQPFEEHECGWRILTRNGPGENWVWVRYPIGEFMKRRLGMCCSGGFGISYEERTGEDCVFAKATLLIYDPARPTEHRMVVEGLGEHVLQRGEKLTDADVCKSARTYALKDACLECGMGVGEGKRVYTIPYTNPDGAKTDKNGVPLEAYKNNGMGGRHRKARKTPADGATAASALINATAVKVWLGARVDQVDATHLGKDALARHTAALAKTLEDMLFDPQKVIAAAWGEGDYNIQQIIALQNLTGRRQCKQEIQHLLDG